jgi:hypothetical protein
LSENRMTMVEVFKTDVKKADQARRMLRLLLANNPVCRINFDLEDCDKVLRVEGREFCPNRVMELLRLNGHRCEVLE